MNLFNHLPTPTTKEQIETPRLLIDLDIMESNIRKMADFFHDKPAKLRPHAKTHKSPVIAKKQMEAGSAVGITVAKLGEAEVMVNGGIKNILIANQVVEPTKVARLAALSKHANLIIAVDNIDNVKLLDQAAAYYKTKINVLIEVNVGLNRCGVDWGQPVLKLSREIKRTDNITLRGLMGYEGHAVLKPDISSRKVLAEDAMSKLINSTKLLEANGFPVEIISGGGTGTYNITGLIPGINEIQAGSYLFMDSTYQKTGVAFEQALTIYVTIISQSSEENYILDAGIKGISIDNGLPTVKGHPDWKIKTLHEEYAYLCVPGGTNQLKIGDKIELIPSHSCTTINLHDSYYALRNNRIEAVWEIKARGRFQ
jgi:D-serine deaminase-like pyridoxal phosphate-dependent protein